MRRREMARRALIKAGLAAPLALPFASAAADVSGSGAMSSERLLADVRAYAGAGNKQSGGPGDRWTAGWTAEQLTAAGYAVQAQAFDAPFFEAKRCELVLGDAAIPVIAQPLVVPTPPAGITAPLQLAEIGGRLDGSIAVVRLPYRRWSSLIDAEVRKPVADAVARGAAAVVVVTNGPTGEALLLNAHADAPFAPVSIALLAPRKAAPVVEAAQAGRVVRLHIEGQGGVRPAQNIIGQRIVARAPWIVISTPRSGWTDCVGERGPGIAIWLALAQWLPRQLPRHSVLMVTNSGHEYENLGAKRMIEAFGPPPERTALWLHLGANVATRDWHELPDRLLPLPSADPFRFLMTSDDLVAQARAAFRNQPGLEMAYSSAEGAAGELQEIVEAGYPRHAGIFGAHRQHHAASDTLETILPDALHAAARGCCALIASALQPRI